MSIFSKYKKVNRYKKIPNAMQSIDVKRVFSDYPVMKEENISYAISILKELYPAHNFINDAVVANLIEYEFDCECTAEQVSDFRLLEKYNEETDRSLIFKHTMS